jgi:hypothetical protein
MKNRLSLLLFCIGIAFWPVFAVLTILEERAGVTWLHTDSSRLWLPVAALAVVGAVGAPLITNTRFVKRWVGVVCAVLGYAAAYGLVVFVGTSFLGWAN